MQSDWRNSFDKALQAVAPVLRTQPIGSARAIRSRVPTVAERRVSRSAVIEPEDIRRFEEQVFGPGGWAAVKESRKTDQHVAPASIAQSMALVMPADRIQAVLMSLGRHS